MNISSKETLVGNAGLGLVAMCNFTLLLGFDNLVQPVLPRSTLGNASSELVDDLDFAVQDHIVFVTLVEVQSAQGVAYEILSGYASPPNATKSGNQTLQLG